MTSKPLEILLIDDNPNDAELTKHALNKMGIPYRLTYVYDGEEALELLASRIAANELPQLIIADLKLPKIGGLELLRHLNLQEPPSAIPVIILSGSGREEDKTAGLALGAVAYIDKSLPRQELAEAFKPIVLKIIQEAL